MDSQKATLRGKISTIRLNIRSYRGNYTDTK